MYSREEEEFFYIQETPQEELEGNITITKEEREYVEDRRTGGDRLSRALRQSTIGAKGFNDRVRNGIGWDTFARATSSSIFYTKD